MLVIVSKTSHTQKGTFNKYRRR